MFSRYDTMTKSKTKDPVDQDNYPDTLVINYNNVHLSQIPGRVPIAKTDIDRIWYLVTKQLQVSETDDVLLTINSIPYVGMLSPGDYIYIPKTTDLYSITALTGLA